MNGIFLISFAVLAVVFYYIDSVRLPKAAKKIVLLNRIFYGISLLLFVMLWMELPLHIPADWFTRSLSAPISKWLGK